MEVLSQRLLFILQKGFSPQSVKKVTFVIPIERKRLTTKWIGIPFYKALLMGFQSTTVVDRLGMTKQGLSTD